MLSYVEKCLNSRFGLRCVILDEMTFAAVHSAGSANDLVLFPNNANAIETDATRYASVSINPNKRFVL